MLEKELEHQSKENPYIYVKDQAGKYYRITKKQPTAQIKKMSEFLSP